MGVTGLWRLIEPAGKPVPVETLENKVLAVDISIWLHQMVKGYQDAKGAPLPNAHLIGLFQRLCKLLYFRIKPVFVFDGAFPQLKRETIAKRQDNKQKYNSESERIKRELAILLTKKTAISSLLGKQISPKKVSKPLPQNEEDLFKLPALPAMPQNEDEGSESEDETSSSNSSIDLHTVDLESQNFKKLPTKEKYDLLLELKETRKMNSWGRLHELPKKSDNFSDFQLQRLLKRRKVQECLEETEKEMGDSGMSLNELESLLNEEGIDTKIETLPTRRIASNNSTRFLLINDVKQALADAKKKKESENLASTSQVDEITNKEESKKDELEEDLEKAIKMSLECTNEADTASTSKTDDSWTSCMSDSDIEYNNTDSEEEDGGVAPDMTSAKAYIKQYCDFTNEVIDSIVASRNKCVISKNKKSKVDEVLAEINVKEAEIIDDALILSSDDECPNKDSDVNKVNTTAVLDSISDNVDPTESLVVLENLSQEVIILDSTIEESPEKAIHSKEYNVDNQGKSTESSEDDFEDVPQIEQPATKISAKQSDASDESDSDNDFEEVPEIDYKPVVQLTLNVNEALVDDIFEDVFTEQAKNIQSEIAVAPNIEKQIINEQDENEDELQKAIMMSLECVTENNISDSEINKDITEMVNDEPENNKDLNTDIANKELPKTSKTVESLNEILSAQSVKQANKVKEVNNRDTSNKTRNAPMSSEQLNNMVDEIQTEEQSLEQEKGRLDRIGRNITEQMTKEAQELLQIFGIPYIVAPMEAEAQCAFLESVNLTDGTITDDSDIWLFGGRTVYKNFFNQKKHVLQFLAERIEKSFKLTREQLVLLALLVGSDYTTGVDGVGPVTALEILASFPFNQRSPSEASQQPRHAHLLTGLHAFKQWLRVGKRTDNTTLKKKLRNVNLHDDFPSVRVVQAYLDPNIEKSEDKFSWGELDITILRDYTKTKFGWSQHKLDEIIKPVLKRMVERKTQKSMEDYFKKKIDFESLEDQMSKRVKAAVQRIGPELPIGDVVQTVNETKPAGKRKTNKDKEAGPSKAKKKRTDDSVLKNLSVKVVSETKDGKTEIDIKITKTDRFQEIIPQREKDKQSLLQNKMKAIEVFRKTNIDKKKKITKRKPILPKEKAELSESSDSN